MSLAIIGAAVGLVLVVSLVVGVVSYIYSVIEINKQVATGIYNQNTYDKFRYEHNIKVLSKGVPRGTPPTSPPPAPPSSPTRRQPGNVVILRKNPQGPEKR